MSKKKNNYEGIIISVSFFVVVITIGAFHFNGYFDFSIPLATDKLGHFGDFIGGFLGTILTIIATIYVYKTFHSQKRELKSQKKELKLQRQLVAQQQFENTFFNMLNVHRELKNELTLNWNYSISFDHDKSIRKILEKDLRTDLDLIAIQEKLNNGKKSGTDVFQIIRDDYTILFLEKELVNQMVIFENSDLDLLGKLTKVLENLKELNKFYKSFFQSFFNKKKDLESLFSKEVDVNEYSFNDINEYKKHTSKFISSSFEILFERHQHIISHYCRNVYHILKYIRENEKNETLGKDLKKYKNYADIFQSQLNVDEQFLLFYNFIHFHKETDNVIFQTINLVNHYEFLENIGIGNLIKKEHELFYDFVIKGSNRKIKKNRDE